VTEVAIMLEGQNGLNWENWKRISGAVEELGYVGLYRSDHFTNMRPPLKDSLEMWISLAWLADNTRRIEFGPMVSPLSFRDPVFTARMGKDVDDLSGGRLILGVGAGWQEHEHTKFGFDLLELKPRFDRFEEGVQVIHQLLKSEDPVSFEGEYYKVEEAELLPRPQRAGGPPLLIGGRGWNRTLPLTARYADEWNFGFRPAAEFARLNSRLNELLEQEGRRPEQVRRSVVNVTVFGRDDADLARKLEQRGYSEEAIEEFGMIVGTAPQIAEQIAEYGEAGAERVLLQWLELDDIEGLEILAEELL
jgi:F420-dependent oxidoreductase-like protein